MITIARNHGPPLNRELLIHADLLLQRKILDPSARAFLDAFHLAKFRLVAFDKNPPRRWRDRKSKCHRRIGRPPNCALVNPGAKQPDLFRSQWFPLPLGWHFHIWDEPCGIMHQRTAGPPPRANVSAVISPLEAPFPVHDPAMPLV